MRKIRIKENVERCQGSDNNIYFGGTLPTVYCYGQYTYDGGYLDEVVVYGEAVHTGDASTCPLCSRQYNSVLTDTDDGATGFKLGLQIMCQNNKGKR